MTSMTIAEHAMKTKAELLRRGPIASSLAKTFHEVWDEERSEWVEVWTSTLADCPVCLLGAAGAAHYGTPDLGYLDMGIDEMGRLVILDDPDYAEFILALGDLIVERRPDLADDSGNGRVYRFFDDVIDKDSCDPREDYRDKAGPVIELLDELAARFPDDEKVAA